LVFGTSASFKNLNETGNGSRRSSSAKEVFATSSRVGTNLMSEYPHYVFVFDADALYTRVRRIG
jgi:hypothetical protein